MCGAAPRRGSAAESSVQHGLAALLSSIPQNGPTGLPAFLLIHVMRKAAVAQNKALEEALRGSRTRVQRREFTGTGLKGHSEINRRMGDPAYAATPVVDAWLKAIFGS